MMYISLKKYLYWGMGDLHPFLYPFSCPLQVVVCVANSGQCIVEQGAGSGC